MDPLVERLATLIRTWNQGLAREGFDPPLDEDHIASLAEEIADNLRADQES